MDLAEHAVLGLIRLYSLSRKKKKKNIIEIESLRKTCDRNSRKDENIFIRTYLRCHLDKIIKTHL